MLVVALILVAMAVIIFTLKVLRPQTFTDADGVAMGLAFGFAGIMFWLIDILHGQGKL